MDHARGEPAWCHGQRAVPPMVEGRRQRRPDLAHDLDPAVQRRDGRLPVAPRQLGPRRRASGPRRQVIVHLRAARDQLVDPFPQPIEMLGVVIAAGLADPPGCLVAGPIEAPPFGDHPRPAGLRLDPRDIPWLTVHRLEESRVQRVDVDVMARVGPGTQPLELHLGLGLPGAEVGDHVAHRPRRIPVVTRFEPLVGGQAAHQLDQLVPAVPLGVDLGRERVVRRRLVEVGGRLAHEALPKAPSSGYPASSQSSSPPE